VGTSSTLVLEPKLDSLARCIGRIENKLPFSEAELRTNLDLQDVISINLERAVQLSVDIASVVISYTQTPVPSTMAEAFDALHSLGWIDAETAQRMRKAVGFRNISVHEYEKIDWVIVHRIATSHLDDFKKFANQVVGQVGTGTPFTRVNRMTLRSTPS
jgi:uncharacterized protein YutE (UPF0331/DUF86 family)